MFPTRRTNKLLSIASALLFLAGTLLIFSISVGILWGEIEANVYFTQSSGGNLKVKCPLVLSPRESGTIRATITNSIDEDTKPTVISRISQGNGTQDSSQILTLTPTQSQTLEWTVDRSNIIFDRLILVNINQWRYSKLEPNQGTCGILILSLFGLTGLWSLGLTLTVSLLLILSGSMLWLRNHSERDEHSNKVIQISRVFAGLVFAGMFSAVFRWWGLILFFDFLLLVTLAVGFTEIVFSPSPERN
jgi:hypothetical protein